MSIMKLSFGTTACKNKRHTGISYFSCIKFLKHCNLSAFYLGGIPTRPGQGMCKKFVFQNILKLQITKAGVFKKTSLYCLFAGLKQT